MPCVADSHQARLVVCGLGAVLTEEDFEGPEPIDRTRVAGWAEVRYQSRSKTISRRTHGRSSSGSGGSWSAARSTTIPGGDDPVLGELQAPHPRREKLIDEEHISIDAGPHEILKRTLRVVRDTEARESRRLADTVIDRFRPEGWQSPGWVLPSRPSTSNRSISCCCPSASTEITPGGSARTAGCSGSNRRRWRARLRSAMPQRQLREAMVARRAERTVAAKEIVESRQDWRPWTAERRASTLSPRLMRLQPGSAAGAFSTPSRRSGTSFPTRE